MGHKILMAALIVFLGFLTVMSFVNGGWWGLFRQLGAIALGGLLGLGLRYLLRD